MRRVGCCGWWCVGEKARSIFKIGGDAMTGQQGRTGLGDRGVGRHGWMRMMVLGWSVAAWVGGMGEGLGSQVPVDDRVERPAEPSVPAEWFGAAIRPTEARSAEEECAGFHVPLGFRVEVVASEPQIAKPLNMAFDGRGRLWVTQSVEYPYPARSEASARDEIRILEDKDGDGRFESVEVFADRLNIPIGVLPYGDGCLCFSIPNVWYLRDRDGDGRCDTRELVLGPFDTSRDTHGMINSLRMGLDGWVYANHGYNNQSQVSGKDGHRISMQSGNTFRFRPDGSRVELYTQGQVNPFGGYGDEWGIRYTADCHSKPITQLLRGGCYESFGRPHDGLGFVASMMDHLHGSTAISGLVGGMGSTFPASFQENLYCGNVMTSRINRNHVVRQGATVRAVEGPDLLTSDDPWFRPVDLVLGPDGAMYIADFYNKVIGHYEVPLNHPDRDRYRGRIFRIRWVGEEREGGERMVHGAREGGVRGGEVEQLADENPTQRMLAWEALRGQDGIGREEALGLESYRRVPSEELLGSVSTLWLDWHRGGGLPKYWEAFLFSGQPLLVNHAALMAVEARDAKLGEALRRAFREWESRIASRRGREEVRADAGARTALRALGEALGVHGDAGDVRGLLKVAMEQQVCDPILSQGARIAIRQLMRDREVQRACVGNWLDGDIERGKEGERVSVDPASEEATFLIPILMALEGDMPFEAMVAWLSDPARSKGRVEQYLPTLAAMAPADQVAVLLPKLAAQYGESPLAYGELLLAIAEKQGGREGKVSVALREAVDRHWGEWFAAMRTESRGGQYPLRHWHEGLGRASRQWGVEERGVEGEEKRSRFWSSLTHDEDYVGSWETGAWTIDDRQVDLSFCVVGHNGFPDQVDSRRNRVELVDAATQEVLRLAWPPRSDVAVWVHWTLKDLVGRRVRVRCIDEDGGSAYAWIGIGRFQVQGFNPTEVTQAWELLGRTAKTLGRLPAVEEIRRWRDASYLDAGWRMRTDGWLAMEEQPLLSYLLDYGRRMGWAEELMAMPPWQRVERADGGAARVGEPQLERAMLEVLLKRSSSAQQAEMARFLSSRQPYWEELAEVVERGWMPRDTLNAIQEAWWQNLPVGGMGDRLRGLRPALDARLGSLQKQVAGRVGEVERMVGDRERGVRIFKERCGVCHQLDGEGTVLAPQLTGVGQRGLQRLLEDILLPNQNVDEAFRMQVVVLDDGRILQGLVVKRSESVLEVVDQKGERATYPKEAVENEKGSELSLMPDNFLEQLTAQDLADLIGYLRREGKLSR